MSSTDQAAELRLATEAAAAVEDTSKVEAGAAVEDSSKVEAAAAVAPEQAQEESKALSGKKVKISTSDGEVIEIAEEYARMSTTIKNLLDSGFDESEESIPLETVSKKVFDKVIEYCEYRFANPEQKNTLGAYSPELAEWDQKFFDALDLPMMYDVTTAANFLDNKPLLDVMCKGIAGKIRGKSVEEMREILNIKNDFTPEEEEELREQNAWCLDV